MILGLLAAVQASLADLGARARDEGGATAVEYGLIVALIAAVIIAVVAVLGRKVSNAFDSVQSSLP